MNYPMQDGTAKLLTTEEYFKMYSDLCPYQPFLDTVRSHGINSCKAAVFSSFPDYQVVRNEFQKYAGTSLSLSAILIPSFSADGKNHSSSGCILLRGLPIQSPPDG